MLSKINVPCLPVVKKTELIMPGSPLANHTMSVNVPSSNNIIHGARLKRTHSYPAISFKPSHVHNATETLFSKTRRASLSIQSPPPINRVTHPLQKNTRNSKLDNRLDQKLDVLKNFLDELEQNSQNLALKADSFSSTWSHWIASWARPKHQLANFDNAISRYNKSTNNLIRTIHDLKTLNSIFLSDTLAQERLNATISAFDVWKNQLHRIAHQANKLMQLTTPPEYIVNTLKEARTLQSRIEIIQQAIHALSSQENSLRSVRTVVENYINHIHQHNPLDLEPIEDEHCIWLYELKQEIGNSLSSTVTEQQLSQALMTVLEYGKPFPKDLDAFVTVLQLFFPLKKSANKTIDEKAANRIRYFNLLNHLNRNSITKAKNQMGTLQNSKKAHEQMHHQFTIALQHYYKLLLQTQPLSNTEKEALNFFKPTDQNIDQLLQAHRIQRENILAQVNPHYSLEDKFATLASDQAEMGHWSADILQMHQTIYAPSTIKQLIPADNAIPNEYLNNLQERLLVLEQYQPLLMELPHSSRHQSILEQERSQVSTEKILITHFLQQQEKLNSLDQHIVQTKKQLVSQITASKELSSLDRQEQKNIDQSRADNNLEKYNSKAAILTKNIDDALALSNKIKEFVEPSQLREKIEIEFSGYLQTLPRSLSPEQKFFSLLNSSIDNEKLTAYRAWKNEHKQTQRELDQLRIVFRSNLLDLQKEQQRAEKDGGYPEQVSWHSWANHKLHPRLLPHQLEIRMQLALQGKTLTQAYQDLIQLLKEPIQEGLGLRENYQQVVNKLENELLGFTNLEKSFKKLRAELMEFAQLAVRHPTQTQMLVGDIDHFFNIISSPSFGIGSEIKNTLTNAWKRGTIENIVKELLSGTRTDIRGAQDMTPFSPAMIALMDMISYLPYVAGASMAISGGNIANRLGNLLGSIMPVSIPGIVPLFQGLLGVGQVQIEKDIAQKLATQRELEVAGNALIQALNANGSLNERVNTALAYQTERNKTKALGALVHDYFESGKKGVLRRAFETASLWWKHSSLKNKLRFAAITIVAPIAAISTASLLIVSLGSVALIPILAVTFLGIGLFALARSSLLIPPLSNLFARAIGLNKIHEKISDEINNDRIDEAIERLNQERNASALRATKENLEDLKKTLLNKLTAIRKNHAHPNQPLSDMEKGALNQEIDNFLEQEIQRRIRNTLDEWVTQSITQAKAENADNPDALPQKLETFKRVADEIYKQKLTSQIKTLTLPPNAASQ